MTYNKYHKLYIDMEILSRILGTSWNEAVSLDNLL